MGPFVFEEAYARACHRAARMFGHFPYDVVNKVCSGICFEGNSWELPIATVHCLCRVSDIHCSQCKHLLGAAVELQIEIGLYYRQGT